MSLYFFFRLNTKIAQSNSEETSTWSNTKAIEKKIVIFFWFLLFDSLITLINRIPLYYYLSILTHFEDRRKFNKESFSFSLKILTKFFQSANSHLLTLTFHCLVCEKSEAKHHTKLALKEYSDETLSILWKIPYGKN